MSVPAQRARSGHTVAKRLIVRRPVCVDLGTKSDRARTIGKTIAERAREKGVSTVVFDRGGYLYHGRIKALADAAREAGLEF